MSNGTDERVGTWMRYVTTALDVINKTPPVTLLIVFIIVFLLAVIGLGLAFATGYMRFAPLDDINKSVQGLSGTLNTRAEKDEQDRAIARDTALGVVEINLRSRLIDCDRIVRPDIREICLAPFRKQECPK